MSPMIGWFLFVCFVANSSTSDNLPGNMTSGNKKEVTGGKCKDAYNKYIQDLSDEKMWALKMFDASAKLQSGLYSGHSMNMGAFDQCLEVKSDDQGKIKGKYCFANIILLEKFNNRTFTLGICIPDSCNENDEELVHSVLKQNYIFIHNVSVDFRIKENSCQTFGDANPPLGLGATITIILLLFLLYLMAISTLLDIYNIYSGNLPFVQLLTAFSIISNGKVFLKISKSSGQLSFVYGLRVLAMFAIVLLHLRQNRYTEIWIIDSFINAGHYSVETFFVISGFLVAYIHQEKKRTNLLTYYLHRYVRLTPALAAIVLINGTLLIYMGSGPLWTNYAYSAQGKCQHCWWQTLIYIQNYKVNGGDMCVAQAWYLAVDMQLFLLSPLLLHAFKKSPKIGYALLSTTIALITLYNFMYDYIVKAWFRSDYYFTHARATSWFIGFLLGQLILKLQQSPIKVNKILALSMWALSFMIFLMVYVATQKKYRDGIRFIFLMPAWSLAIGWIFFACHFGYGGAINSFLSLPVFQVLSKLTYSTYIVHVMVIDVFHYSSKSSQQISVAYFIKDFIAISVLSNIVGAIWMFTFEIPFRNLEKLCFAKSERVCSNRIHFKRKVSTGDSQIPY